MAERVPQSPNIGDHKTVPKESAHDVEQSHEHHGVPSGPNDYDQEDDYPVERVEAVYRKIDLRIIPGKYCSSTDNSTMPPPSHTANAPRPQPFGSFTSSAPPSVPTSASRRP